jgi:hypothetical protein
MTPSTWLSCVAGHAAETLLRLTAEISGGADHAILVHGTSSLPDIIRCLSQFRP